MTDEDKSLPTSSPVRVAQYLRVSTEHQRYSLLNQSKLISQHAEASDYLIVRTYNDAGRSGLRLAGRPALSALLRDIRAEPDFERVLVFDISRWGRFQDIDESASYEFICRRAGIEIEYCAEPFIGDGSVTDHVLKTIKRAMAAEFSRELSRRVFVGQSRLAAIGFRQGGAVPFGTERVLVDENGVPRQVREFGQRKYLATDRVILVAGASSDARIVQFIFDALCVYRLSPTLIGRLIQELVGEEADAGKWRGQHVKRLLTNPIYAGTLVFNRTWGRLGAAKVANPQTSWIRAANAASAIIPQKQFERAQRVLKAYGGLPRGDRHASLKQYLPEGDRRVARFVASFLGIGCDQLPPTLFRRGRSARIHDNLYHVFRAPVGAGWHAWCRIQELVCQRYFPDREFGSYEKAREAAIAWGQLDHELFAEYRSLSRRLKRRKNNRSGETGVNRRSRPGGAVPRWTASWINSDGRRQSTSFSVQQFGEGRAKSLAIEARRAAVADNQDRLAALTDELRLRLLQRKADVSEPRWTYL